MLDERAGFAQLASSVDWQRRDAAASIVRHQETFARMIDREMTGTRAAGGLLVEQGEVASFGVDAERTDCAGFFAFEILHLADRIKEAAVGMKGEEGGIFCFSGELGGSEFAGFGIESSKVDALAFWAGVGADIDEHGFG